MYMHFIAYFCTMLHILYYSLVFHSFCKNAEVVQFFLVLLIFFDETLLLLVWAPRHSQAVFDGISSGDPQQHVGKINKLE